MIWVHFYDALGRVQLICPAVDAELWWLFDGSRGWRYHLIPEAA